MKIKASQIILAAGISLLSASCADKASNSTDGMAIAIHPTVKTRVTESSFENGDRIGVNINFESSSHAENAMMKHNGTSFVSEEVKWYAEGNEATFEAYYPYQAEYPKTFTIQENQTGEGYYDSDLLLAYATNVKPNINGVSLEFHHVMSQVVITVYNQSEEDVASLYISNSKDKVYFDHENMSAGAHVLGREIVIQAQNTSADTFRAVIAPQNLSLGIEVRNTKGGYSVTTLNNTTFEPGKSYRASVTLDDNYDITDAHISSKSDIVDWEDGGQV